MEKGILQDQMNELLPAYKEYMNDKELNELTKDQYQMRLRKFIEFMDEKYVNPPTKIEYITEEHVNFFLNYKRENGSAIVSCDGYLHCIKAFFKFLYERGTLKNFILYDVRVDFDWKEYIRDYQSFTQSEIQVIIEYLRNLCLNSPTYNNVRNYTMILLIVYGALTLNEIHLLDLSDVNLRTRKLSIRATRDRQIFISDFLANALEEYIEIRSKYTDCEYLFVSRQSNRIARKSIQDAVKKILKDSGVYNGLRKLDTKLSVS